MRFVDMLEEKAPDVYRRLSECKNTRDDLQVLVNVRWMWMIENGKDQQGFTKEDALVDILLLDRNNQFMNLTKEEWNELIS